MFVPRRLRISGFRGFREPVDFFFGNPAILLYGENHHGKSSTLNAIEWCLFGDDCSGQQTGIRERVGWIVPNQHLASPEVSVALELVDHSGPFLIERHWSRQGRQAVKKNLFVTLPSGEKLSGSEAEERLVQLTGATFRDFLTTVYQHQEAIRAVLTHEPRERNDAIDRLLGLSVYRNLMDAIAKAKASDRQKTLRREFEAFEGEVRTALSARENDLKDLREEVAGTGIPFPQQNEKTAFVLAKLVTQSLEDFARQAALAAQTLNTPNSWTDLAGFETEAKRAIQWFRAEMPDAKIQADLYRRHKILLQLKTDLEHRRSRTRRIESQTAVFSIRIPAA